MFHDVYIVVSEYNQVVLQVRRFCQNAFFVHGICALCQWMSAAVARRVDAGIRPMRRGEEVGQTSKYKNGSFSKNKNMTDWPRMDISSFICARGLFVDADLLISPFA